jgi:hypothetical protein
MQYPVVKPVCVVVLGVVLASCSDSHVPTAPLEASRISFEASTQEGDELPCVGGESLLLIQDNVPWAAGEDQHTLGANVTELIAQGTSFCAVNSEAAAAMELSRFSTVVISAAQAQAFYDNLFPVGSVHPAITSFVERGGVLVANLADVASGPGNNGNWAGDAFVGGLRRVTAFRNDNAIAHGSHPIIAGPSECPSGNCAEIRDILVRQDLDNWLHSSHGYFTALPAGTTVLLTQPDATRDGEPEPIMVEYPVGQGRVIASMVTSEQRYSGDKARSLKLLANELAYAISMSPPVATLPLTVDEQIAALTAYLESLVEAGELGVGNANSLNRKLIAAARSLEAGRARTAAHQIRAFMHEVDALVRSGRLSLEKGEFLLESARALLDALTED